ncbi:MAG: AI-2E family transporter [Tyzzerella sp.]|nr:AI-2E family transporter [Tyzzerella sp.]
MDLDKHTIKKIRGLILFTIFVLVALWNYEVVFDGIQFIWGVISPFVLGGVIAFIVNIPMRFFEEKIFNKTNIRKKKWAEKIARPSSLILALIVIIGIIATVVLIVIPQLGNTILNLGKTIQDFIPKAQAWAIQTFEDNQEIAKWIADIDFKWDEILSQGLDFLKNGASSVLGSTFEAAMSIISGVATFFIAVVFACYVLVQKEKLGEQVKKLMYAFLPEDWNNILLALGSVVNKSFTNFFTGQCLEAVILGLMFLVVMVILRLPYALLISVLIAFTALIPIFGAFIGCGVGALLIFMISPTKALIFIIMFLVLQQIEGNFIYPHVVGNSVGLPSIWVLVAVSVGGSLMGLSGMLIFIPITAVVYTMLRGIVNRRLGLKE